MLATLAGYYVGEESPDELDRAGEDSQSSENVLIFDTIPYKQRLRHKNQIARE